MKSVFIFIVSLLVGILIVIGYGFIKKNPGKPIDNIIQTVTKPLFSIDNAPTQAINGTITQMSGNINWESRVATEASRLTSSTQIIQQGEEISTEENGQISINFPDTAEVSILPKTQLDFIQTLPVNFVTSIASGSATFKKLSVATPVSVKSYHLLINLNSGEMNVNLDLDKGLTNIKVTTGTIIVGYNDLDLVSHVANFQAPSEVSFNDSTRTFESE